MSAPTATTTTTTDEAKAPQPNEKYWLWFFGILVAAFLILLVKSKMPIELWDESRQAINALEMYQHGFSFATTYDFKPDLWNTKPPLLIWLIYGCFHLLGVSTFALRLPTTLASVGTVLLAGLFAKRVTGSARAAAVTAVVLLSSWVFCGLHSSLAADFDGLLTFFLTLTTVSFYKAVHEDGEPKWNRWLLVGLGLACAVITKSIAGCLLLPGMFLYLLFTRQAGKAFKQGSLWLALGMAIVIIGSVYAARESVEPGYLHAAFQNEIGQRFVSGIQGQDPSTSVAVTGRPLYHGPIYYYVSLLSQGAFSLGPLFLLFPFVIRSRASSIHQAGLYLTFVAYTALVVYSVAATKFSWYIVPIVPLISILAALCLEALFRLERFKPALLYALAVLAVAYHAVNTCKAFLHWSRRSDVNGDRKIELWNYGNNYADLFSDFKAKSLNNIQVVDGGVYNDEGIKNYSPQLRWYILTNAAKGLNASFVHGLPEVAKAPGSYLATCDPRYLDSLKSQGDVVEATRRWTIVRIKQG